MRISLFLIAMLCVVSCTNKKDDGTANSSSITQLIQPPDSIVLAIKQSFPGAITTSEFADSLFKTVHERYGIQARDMLMGASTCVDDIIFTKNFHRHKEIEGPFHMGGLGGLPFAGISGLNAFSHHVPEGGAMILFIGPHIGYSSESGWGYVLRPGQLHASSCCGALVGALSCLEKGTIVSGPPDEDDYEGSQLNQFTLSHSKEILESPNKIVALTNLTSKEAENRIRRYLPRIEVEHYKYIITVAGVLINTDYQYVDYFSTSHYSVYDVEKKVYLEDVRFPQ